MANAEKAVPFDPLRYDETLEKLPKSLKEVLTSYSNIPEDEQIEHVVKLRNEAYSYFPYPCIGTFRFIEFDLAAHSAYQDHVLLPLKKPTREGEVEPLFLDLGTCFGQDLRKLVYDGVPVDRLWASDIEPKFIELGFQLFKDANKLPKDHFLCPGNVLSDSPDDKLRLLDEKVTILHMTSVFHLFSLEDQKKVADRCLRLLRKDTGGPVLIVGSQVGSTIPGAYQTSKTFTHKWRHDEGSWRDLWEELSQKESWKDKIKNVEVKSRLLDRAQTKDPESGKITVFTQPQQGSTFVWQMFEVWITFS